MSLHWHHPDQQMTQQWPNLTKIWKWCHSVYISPFHDMTWLRVFSELTVICGQYLKYNHPFCKLIPSIQPSKSLVVCIVPMIESQYRGSMGWQFTRSCCKNSLGITVWWLASKVIASRSTSTVFCLKILWVGIRNAFRNCVSNWKFSKSTHWVWLAVAKKRFRRSGNSRPVYGATPYASNTAVSNSQSSNHDVDVGFIQLIDIHDKSRFHRARQHPKPTPNVMWMAWGQKKVRRRCVVGEKLKSVEIRTRCCFLPSSARFKNSPGGQTHTWIGQWIFVKYIIAGICSLCWMQ